MLVLAVGVGCLQEGLQAVSQVRSRRCVVGAWPWVEPSVDVVQKPRLGRDQSCSLPQKMNLTSLLRRSPVDGQRKPADVGDMQKPWLPGAPDVTRPQTSHNAAALAYMGDAIFELYVRRHFLTPPQSMDKYNHQVMALVCCEAQHAILQKLVKSDFLTEEERDVLRWGKNVDASNRSARRRAGNIVYSSASSLETLIGYLYLKDVPRLEEVMAQMGFNAEKSLPEFFLNTE